MIFTGMYCVNRGIGEFVCVYRQDRMDGRHTYTYTYIHRFEKLNYLKLLYPFLEGGGGDKYEK